ncbi:MAG: Gx transporter family protein [Spirochaetota bacterium]
MHDARERRLDLVAFFGALCLFFSTIEYLFPKPFPFFRLGLANLPVLLALDLFSPGYVLLLVLLKVVGQGLVSGTLASYVFLFSLAGSFASVFVMLAVYRAGERWISLIGVSLFGSLASNIVQVTLSVTFIFGQSAWVIAPPFLAIGVASGLAVGLFAQRFRMRSRWFSAVRGTLHGS